MTDKIKNYFELHKKRITLYMGLLLVIFSSLIIINANKDASDETFLAEVEKKSSENSKETTENLTGPTNVELNTNEETIKIDIKGSIVNPGVYELEKGSRVIDAINKAGGLLPDAYTKYINLSQILKDENVIIINSTSEIEEILNQKTEIICTAQNDACIKNEDLVTNDVEASNKENKELAEELNTVVNINEASLEELMTLEGIGKEKAESIIKYREENGPFEEIEDIKNVSGIGESVYAKIKENITTR